MSWLVFKWVSRLTCDSVMSHIWMSPVTHMNESCHTYDCHKFWWVIYIYMYIYIYIYIYIHMWISHFTHAEDSMWRCKRVPTLCDWASRKVFVKESHALICTRIHTLTYTHTHSLQHIATPCNTLQHSAKHLAGRRKSAHFATHCNKLQHTWLISTRVLIETHCNALQRTATHYNTLQHTATHLAGRRKRGRSAVLYCKERSLQRTSTHMIRM